MAAITHLHSDFGSVFAIEAVNEEIMDADQTPGYGDCKSNFWCAYMRVMTQSDARMTVQKNFVKTVRAVELSLGIPVPGAGFSLTVSASANFTSAISAAANANSNTIFTPEVKAALKDAIPILVEVSLQLGLGFDLGALLHSREPLVTKYVFSQFIHLHLDITH